MRFRHETETPLWELFDELPETIQARARKQFALLETDPWHPSLQFGGSWSARVNDSYRVMATLRGGVLTWFWIGKHDAYEVIANRM